MAVRIEISVDEEQKVAAPVAGQDNVASLAARFDELVRQMGEDLQPFPQAKLGGYMSHFQIVFEITVGEKSQIVSVTSPLAAQTVSWGSPFTYEGPQANHTVRLPMPKGSKLPAYISDTDFLIKPPKFFEAGKETIWLQILNLDARMESSIGPMRIILGETLKREYPDIFKPSHGVAQSLGSRGFPARLFFNPYAIIETPAGAFRAIHGTLSYGRVTAFPPVGTPVSISDCIPIQPVESVRECMARGAPEAEIQSIGRIIALSHPIDMAIQLSGEECFDFVERCVADAQPSAS